MEKAHKFPESPKAIKILESFAHQVPGNFQNITPNMPTINTPLLYRKDNLDGRSSNVCTDDKFFYEEIVFSGKNWIINKYYRQFIKDHKSHAHKLKRIW